VVDLSGHDAPLDILRELSSKDQILSADRRRREKEQNSEPHDIGKYARDCTHQVPHARIRPELAGGCICLAL